jgi:hypothetical protein
MASAGSTKWKLLAGTVNRQDSAAGILGHLVVRVPEKVLRDTQVEDPDEQTIMSYWYVSEELETHYIIQEIPTYIEDSCLERDPEFGRTGCWRTLNKLEGELQCLDGNKATIFRSDNDFGAIYVRQDEVAKCIFSAYRFQQHVDRFNQEADAAEKMAMEATIGSEQTSS